MLEKKKTEENIQIFWSFPCKQSGTRCNIKPTGNIGYILTEFNKKNTIEAAQLMQHMLLYCKVLS